LRKAKETIAQNQAARAAQVSATPIAQPTPSGTEGTISTSKQASFVSNPQLLPSPAQGFIVPPPLELLRLMQFLLVPHRPPCHLLSGLRGRTKGKV